MLPKIIANYLPQFHEIPENNERWGEGFTERVNLKKAKPLFKGHRQPKIPLNHNYYNLLNPEVRKRQGELAKKYGIDGFCYYHYWFEGGKKLLEKPAELLLQDGYPNLPFCFCWDNNARIRSWDNSNKILMNQNYGNQKDWENHFMYLLPFFHHNLYIRKDNKPVFCIHHTETMNEYLTPMLNYREKLAKRHSLSGLYIVEVMHSAQHVPASSISNAIVEFEPLHTLRNAFTFSLVNNIILHGINTITEKLFHTSFFINKTSYNKVWEAVLHKNPHKNSDYKGKDIIFGSFVGRDNSPRKGNNSIIMNNSNPYIYQQYFNQLYTKAKEKKSDFIFLNARNERTEGAYLEPDEENKFDYLEAIKSVVDKNTFT